MKKTLSFIGLISMALVIGLAIVSCGGGGSPSAVVKDYYSAVQKGDTDKMSKLMTGDMAGMAALLADSLKEAAAEQGKITKTEETIDGDEAYVTVTYANGDTEEYELVKEDGKWKIVVDK